VRHRRTVNTARALPGAEPLGYNSAARMRATTVGNPHHVLRRNAQHPVAGSGQPPIATRICSLSRCVVATIDLDVRLGSREVDDTLAEPLA